MDNRSDRRVVRVGKIARDAAQLLAESVDPACFGVGDRGIAEQWCIASRVVCDLPINAVAEQHRSAKLSSLPAGASVSAYAAVTADVSTLRDGRYLADIKATAPLA